MARNQIDEIDLVALLVFPIAAGIELGVWTLQLDVMGSYDFSAPLVSLGGADISIAFLATIASLVALIASGMLTKDNFTREEGWGIGAVVAVVPVYVFVPAFANLIEYSDIIPLVVWLAISAGAVFISYKA